MTKKQNILTDLLQGRVVNMLHNMPRYGSSLRSRISEFRQDGYYILSRVADKSSGSLEYYLPKCAKINFKCHAF